MKILRTSLLLLLTAIVGFNIVSISAQEDKDSVEIKKVIEMYLQAIAFKDINSAMQYVSKMFYDDTDKNNIIDYIKQKAELEKEMKSIDNNFADYSFEVLRLYNLNIKDNKANVEMEFQLKGFNLDTLKEKTKKGIRVVSLQNEDGFWKITGWKHLRNLQK